MQLEHQRHGCVAQRDARLHQAPQLQQADAEAVDAGFGTVHEAALRHRTEDAVRRRRVQPGFQRKLLERHGVGVLGKHVQQLHHAIDDLDGVLALGGGRGVDLLGGHGERSR